jgi:hypothetical protein
VVSLTLHPLYLWEQNHRFLFSRRLNVPQSWPGIRGSGGGGGSFMPVGNQTPNYPTGILVIVVLCLFSPFRICKPVLFKLCFNTAFPSTTNFQTISSLKISQYKCLRTFLLHQTLICLYFSPSHLSWFNPHEDPYYEIFSVFLFYLQSIYASQHVIHKHPREHTISSGVCSMYITVSIYTKVISGTYRIIFAQG